MFSRAESSYVLDPRAIDWILADDANPLNQIGRLIPNGSVVLDVGTGNGILAHLLARSSLDTVIDGIEPARAAAEAARPYYRRFLASTADECLNDLSTGLYDFIVLADVVEHLADPTTLLKMIQRVLKVEGTVLLSTPNVAFASVRAALLNGRFDYVDSGILERTHLRFFTLSTLMRLVSSVELHAESVYLLKRDPLSTEIPLDHLPIGLSDLIRIARDELSFVYQFLLVLKRTPATLRFQRAGSGGTGLVSRYLVKRVTNALRFSGKRSDRS